MADVFDDVSSLLKAVSAGKGANETLARLKDAKEKHDAAKAEAEKAHAELLERRRELVTLKDSVDEATEDLNRKIKQHEQAVATLVGEKARHVEAVKAFAEERSAFGPRLADLVHRESALTQRDAALQARHEALEKKAAALDNSLGILNKAVESVKAVHH